MTSGNEKSDMVSGTGTRYESQERFRSLRGIREEAAAVLGTRDWDYLWCGVGDEVTVAWNSDRFAAYQLAAPLFAGIVKPDTSTTFLGMTLRLPLLIAPFGNDAVFHPDGHLAVGRAAASAGIAQMVPVAASYRLEDVAAASAAAKVFQMTFVGSDRSVQTMIERAAAAGYEYICASDSPTLQWRERLIESSYSPVRSDPDVNFGHRGLEREALEELRNFSRPRWGWEDVRSAIRESPLPVIIKGVQSVADASEALEAGAAALYISNYGGREVDRVPATIDLVAGIRDAVGRDASIILDSGIRRGSDIATALALGADVVAVGRLAALGLAAGGEYGVRRVIQLLEAELASTMGRLGCSAVGDLSRRVFTREHRGKSGPWVW